MPIYEYACKNCGHQLEAFQGIKDAPLVNCEQCHQPTLVKLVSAAGFRLKGGGWYETDFKSNPNEKRNLASNDSSAPESTGTDSVSTTSTTTSKTDKTTSKTDNSNKGVSPSSSTTGSVE